MSKDLDILKKIEKNLGIEFEKVDKELFNGEQPTRSYCTDDKTNIIGLDLIDQNISDISVLKDLQNLTMLYLRDNQISDISALKDLHKLTKLNLYNNQISDISALKDLQELLALSLAKNQISDISALRDLQHLTRLGLSQNQISDISALKDLQKLIYLWVNDNQISDISAFKDLQELTVLYLADNRLTTLPKWITESGLELKWGDDDEWKGVYLENNPIESPPIEIVKKGTDAVRAYFKSLEGKMKALNEIKVLLVGDGGAGKTSLVKHLLGIEFDKDEPQTHGIKIEHWDVEEGQKNIKIRLWDFGGQEIMHATHQFFLSKRSLYVLVLDGRKDEKTEYWLKHIESFGGDSPILVVINKIDENPLFSIDCPTLQEKYKGIKGFYRTSCLTKEGIKPFREALINELAAVDLIHTNWGQSWFNVKDKLENMDDHFISYEQYKEVCEEEGVNDLTGQNTLIDFLNDLGVILHLKEFELEGTNVLDPKWATNGVYKIINSKKLGENEGILRLMDLKDILIPSKKRDYEFPRDKYPFIIGLMKKFELCYELNNKTVLIPDLLNVTRPEFDYDYDSSLRFIISYDFFPRSVIPRFIVKMHSDIKDDLRWRTGCVLEDKLSKSTAVIRADNEAKKIEIFVNGDKIKRKDYFATILYSFREINSSFEKLEFTELVPMPDEPKVTVSYEHLMTLVSNGINEFIPDGSKIKHKVSDLLGLIQLEKDTDEKMLHILRKIENRITDKKSFFEAANRIVNLKPNVCGVGFDINEFLNVLAEKYFSKD